MLPDRVDALWRRAMSDEPHYGKSMATFATTRRFAALIAAEVLEDARREIRAKGWRGPDKILAQMARSERALGKRRRNPKVRSVDPRELLQRETRETEG